MSSGTQVVRQLSCVRRKPYLYEQYKQALNHSRCWPCNKARKCRVVRMRIFMNIRLTPLS